MRRKVFSHGLHGLLVAGRKKKKGRGRDRHQWQASSFARLMVIKRERVERGEMFSVFSSRFSVSLQSDKEAGEGTENGKSLREILFDDGGQIAFFVTHHI